ncbi:MAG: LVIVD repeat-containing protein [Planctomycetota bacterium]|jgi:hypothetical protein
MSESVIDNEVPAPVKRARARSLVAYFILLGIIAVSICIIFIIIIERAVPEDSAVIEDYGYSPFRKHESGGTGTGTAPEEGVRKRAVPDSPPESRRKRPVEPLVPESETWETSKPEELLPPRKTPRMPRMGVAKSITTGGRETAQNTSLILKIGSMHNFDCLGITIQDARGFVVEGNNAYIACGRKGVLVFNISDPEEVSLAYRIKTRYPACDLYVKYRRAYIATLAGLDIFESDRYESRMRMKWKRMSSTKLWSANNTSPTSIARHGSNIYILVPASFFDAGIYGVNVSNPRQPGGKTYTRAYAGSEKRGLFVSGNYAFSLGNDSGSDFVVSDVSHSRFSDEVVALDLEGEAGSFYVYDNYAYVGCGNAFNVIDIEDPLVPDTITRLELECGAEITGIHVLGNHAYTVRPGMVRLEVIDVSNPLEPWQAAVLKLPRRDMEFPLSARWYVFPYRRHVYILSPSENCIYVVTVNLRRNGP